MVIVTPCPGGLGCPCVVLKLRIKGDTLIIGAVGDGGCCTVNSTSTDCVFCPAMTEIVALYVPDFILSALTPTAGDVVVAPFNWPFVGVIVSQLADELACHSIAFVPQLEVAVRPSV